MEEKELIKGKTKSGAELYLKLSVFIFSLGAAAGMVILSYAQKTGVIVLAASFIPAAALIAVYVSFSRTIVTVTDRRIYGKNILGEDTEIQLSSVSRVEMSGNNGVTVFEGEKGTVFSDMDNGSEVYSEIVSIITDKAGRGGTDGFMQLYDLFSAGEISEEEYLRKKKELLKLS